MDRRKISKGTNKLNLGLKSTLSDIDIVSSQIYAANTKKRKLDADENPNSQFGGTAEANRASSKLSECSQTSTKSRLSVMSKLTSMRSIHSQKPSTSNSNLSRDNVQNVPSVRTPERSQINPLQSLGPNTSEFQKNLHTSDTELSPLRLTNSKTDDATIRKNILKQLSTPTKGDGSDSDISLFSQSSSAKKRRKSPLDSPIDKNNEDQVNSPKRNVSRRLRELDDISPMKGNIFSSTRNDEFNKSLVSPDRPTRNEVEFASPRAVQTTNKFILFLNAAGVILKEDDEPHQIKCDPNEVKSNFKKLLQSNESKYKKEEIIADWKNFIEVDSNFEKASQDLKVVTDGLPFPSWYNTSLIKLLLHISELQKPLLESLLQKLNEVILEATEPESVSWTFNVIQQIRFLEFIEDPEALTTSLENIIESTPVWFHKEFIVFLPDIIVDSQHHAIGDILMKLFDLRPELMNIILDTLSTLSMGEMYYEELRINLINMLEGVEPRYVPAITKFVFNNCNNERAAEKILQMLRTLHLEPLLNSDIQECFTNQLLTVNEIISGMKMFKKVAQASVKVIETEGEEAVPMDLIYLLVYFANSPAAQKNAESILKKNYRSGYYRLSLFNTLYKDYLEVARELEPSALELASNLIKSDDRVYTELAIEWFILMFMSRQQIYQQRQVLEKILQLVGYNNSTAKKIFTILSKIIADDEKRNCLQSHCNLLSILLEKMDDLDLESAAILSDVLHGMYIQTNSTVHSLDDDLFILMQKQLASSKILTKCKGVLSACMSIKHFASKSETHNLAKVVFDKVIFGVKSCARSRALFYDSLSLVISESKNLDKQFLEEIKSFATTALQSYLISDNLRNDMEKKFELNSLSDSEEMIIDFKEGKFGGIVPILFRLLRMCCTKLSEDGSLEDINALLGCAILLPIDLEISEPENLNYMIYCINWFRELISAFVTEPSPSIKKQVLKRLDSLMKMQGDFQISHVSCITRYEPPLAYFSYFPDKPFVKIEKKSTKKGKKGSADKTHTLSIPEWETFDLGSLLVSKNPTYFRKLDTRVVHLLNIKMDMTLTQTSAQAVSIAQVCFVVKELLGMIGNDNSESLMQDLIHLLPQICTKLSDIADELRINEDDDCQKREALVLLLRLVNQIFSWKELLNSVKYNSLLTGGLRAIASEMLGISSTQVANEDLVANACKFFETMCEIAENRSIVLAQSIVNVCVTLMKYSKSFSAKNSEKYATMAYNFLHSGDWLDKHAGILYRNAVAGLIKTWIENKPCLKKVMDIMDWLKHDAILLEKPSDCLPNLPSINRNHFPLLFNKVLESLVKGTKVDLKDSKSDSTFLEIWRNVGSMISEIIRISRTLKLIKTVNIISVKYQIQLLRLFMTQGFTIIELNLKYHKTDVLQIIKYFQGSTRYLHEIYCTVTRDKDITMTRYCPIIKAILDEYLCRVKGMMVLNEISDVLTFGKLVRKDIGGQKIQSQASSAEDSSSVNDLASVSESSASEFCENNEVSDRNSDSGDLYDEGNENENMDLDEDEDED